MVGDGGCNLGPMWTGGACGSGRGVKVQLGEPGRALGLGGGFVLGGALQVCLGGRGEEGDALWRRGPHGMAPPPPPACLGPCRTNSSSCCSLGLQRAPCTQRTASPHTWPCCPACWRGQGPAPPHTHVRPPPSAHLPLPELPALLPHLCWTDWLVGGGVGRQGGAATPPGNVPACLPMRSDISVTHPSPACQPASLTYRCCLSGQH